jgi:hypothetical protein
LPFQEDKADDRPSLCDLKLEIPRANDARPRTIPKWRAEVVPVNMKLMKPHTVRKVPTEDDESARITLTL